MARTIAPRRASLPGTLEFLLSERRDKWAVIGESSEWRGRGLRERRSRFGLAADGFETQAAQVGDGSGRHTGALRQRRVAERRLGFVLVAEAHVHDREIQVGR